MNEEVSFGSKVDTWLLVVLLTAVAACVVGAAYVYPLLDQGTMRWMALLVALLIVLLGVGAALPLWLLMDTRYTLSETHVHVRSGPFRWHIPIGEIRQVTPTRELGSSPALSLDRLEIRYGDDKSMMISPENRDVFLRSLEARRNARD